MQNANIRDSMCALSMSLLFGPFRGLSEYWTCSWLRLCVEDFVAFSIAILRSIVVVGEESAEITSICTTTYTDRVVTSPARPTLSFTNFTAAWSSFSRSIGGTSFSTVWNALLTGWWYLSTMVIVFVAFTDTALVSIFEIPALFWNALDLRASAASVWIACGAPRMPSIHASLVAFQASDLLTN